jgi:ethanolamine utilization protein EutN
MQLGHVVGKAVATIKHPSMNGCRLLVVQPMMSDGRSPDGDPLIVVDAVGAGAGQRVLITSDGAIARELLSADATPVRWTTIGIQDGNEPIVD